MNDEDDTRLYGEIAYILNKIADKCESMDGGWDDLLNHLAEVDDSEYKTQRDLYLNWAKFLRNVYWRIRPWDAPQKFNRVRKKQVHKGEGETTAERLKLVDGFEVWNYNHKMYLWAMEKDLSYSIGPSSFDVPAGILTAAELQRFEKMAEEDK